LYWSARRDEEKARAKERIFSVRDDFGAWDPKLQRPELWNILNGKVQKGHNVRVFPISNWTELDIWNYIKKYNIELPNLYFSHDRECIKFQDKLVATSAFIQPQEGDEVVIEKVRYRTVGDMTCTELCLLKLLQLMILLKILFKPELAKEDKQD
jgi:sulfate adenylyltransferase subunit 2